MVLIPQRFQVVNDLSAFNAGWRLLALMLCSPLGSVISGYLIQSIKLPPTYVFLVGAILQTIGLALMGTLNVSDPNVPSAQYGYQVILGLGIGLTLSSLLIGAPTVIKEKDTGMSRLLNFLVYRYTCFPVSGLRSQIRFMDADRMILQLSSSGQ